MEHHQWMSCLSLKFASCGSKLPLRLLSSDKVLGSAYEVVVPQNPPLPYYVAILLDKKRLRRLGEPQTLPFSSSQMGRQLLAVTVELVGVDAGPLLLATAHLESTKDEGWWAWGNHRAIGCP